MKVMKKSFVLFVFLSLFINLSFAQGSKEGNEGGGHSESSSGGSDSTYDNGWFPIIVTREGDDEDDSQRGLTTEEIAAMEASKAAAEAIKKVSKIQKKIEDIKKSIEEKRNSLPSPTGNILSSIFNKEITIEQAWNIQIQKNMEKQLQQLEQQAQQAQQEANKKLDDMKKAYEQLSQTYNVVVESGDPVYVATGNFHVEYDDFVAEDNVTNFSIIRKRTENTSMESFGKNWTCPLDSRIIRTYRNYEPTEKQEFQILHDSYQEIIDACDDYFNKYYNYSAYELFLRMQEAQMIMNAYQEVINYCNNRENEISQIEELNKYVKYGKYSATSSYVKNAKMLVYIDDNGTEYTLIKDKDGNWTCGSGIASKEFILNILSDGTYCVTYQNGKKKIYSKYGILSQEIDRNGNVIKYNSNNGRINSIELPTGEVVTVKRNPDGTISKIYGDTSGQTEYLYTNGNLSSVTDNKGINVSWKYDSEGFIKRIIKADGSTVDISYIKDGVTGRKVCSEVINENGEKESFIYDYRKGIVKHVDITELIENYQLTNGFTTLYEDGKGKSKKISLQSNGLISSVTENGVLKTYSYNDLYKPETVSFSDGGLQKIYYNNFGDISYFSDKDGFFTSYDYDTKGNIIGIYYCGDLITSINYYSNGLVRNLTEKGITYEYEYNRFGNITKKNWVDSYGRNVVERWEYDDKNRISKFVGIDGVEETYSYLDNSKLIKLNTKEILIKYNERGWIAERQEKDLKTNEIFSLKFNYDGRGNVRKVFLNDMDYLSYRYNQFGEIIEAIIRGQKDNADDYYKEQYIYDSYGNLIQRNVGNQNEIIEKYKVEYIYDKYQTTVKKYIGNQVIEIYYYDENGRLKKSKKQDGYQKTYSYSKNGKILLEEDNKGRKKTYTYKNDGTVQIKFNRKNGSEESYNFSEVGKLLEIQNGLNQKTVYSYDSYGRVINQLTISGEKEYVYDKKGRIIKEVIKDKKGNICYIRKNIYDDENRTKSVYEGDYLICIEYYDAWNRVVKKSGAKGTQYYKYDWFGNVTEKIDEEGNKTEYEYSPSNKLIKSNGLERYTYKWTAGDKLSEIVNNGKKIYSADYDMAGRIICEKNQFGNEVLYGYDSNGILNRIERYDTGIISYSNQVEQNEITAIDENSSIYSYEIGEDGNICKEIDCLGNEILYKRDKIGRIIEKKNSSGNSETYSYDDMNNSFKISFENGQTISVKKDLLNDITEIQTVNDKSEYKYDTSGRMTESIDKLTGTVVEYLYDEWGRCNQKKSNSFNYVYEYDSCGRIIKIEDLFTRGGITFEYDKKGNVIKQKYSNGIQKQISYDEFGRKCVITGKLKNGLIFSEEKIKYDENGRITTIQNEKDEFFEYLYDEKGRLVTVYSPYSDEILENSKEEAIECGLGIKNETPVGEIRNNQYCWFEKFDYTKTGNIKSISNPLGTIIYDYDKMNRLINKHGSNSDGLSGIFYVWNDNNCLVNVKSSLREITIEYGEQSRPKSFTEQSFLNGENMTVLYEYDAIGRRISENVNECKTKYIYDGLSNEVLISTIVTDNGRVFINEKNTFSYDSQNRKYKWFDNSIEKNDIEKRPSSTLHCFGFPFMNSYVDGSVKNGFENEYLFSNYKGSVTGTFNENCERISVCEYDVWGNELKKGKNESFGNSIKRELGNLQIMNLGQRDYIPSIKMFTTMDKLRDGANWFSYCACDPINYIDINGNYKETMSEEEKALYAAQIAEEGKFDWTECHETGSSQGINKEYDCADVSFCIDSIASAASGYSVTSEKQKQFTTDYENGKIEKSKNDIKASDFYNDNGSNMNKTGDRGDATNPAVVTPGTVMSFKDNPNTPGSEDHVLTVIAVDYNDDFSAVEGVAYIEGHTGGDRTEVGYMTVGKGGGYKDGIYNLDNWKGEFAGFYEIENNITIPFDSGRETEKRENNPIGCAK